MGSDDSEVYDRSFARNIGILTSEEQCRLADCTVAVAGLGGIGGNVTIMLARMGVGGFRLADFDSFELANINRQYGATVDNVGRGKCELVVEDLRRINPNARIEVFAEGFTEETGNSLLGGADVAIDAIDFYKIETHVEFHRKTREHGLYTLMGSPVGFSAILQVFDPHGMSLEEYCGIVDEMDPLEKQLRYACGLVPELAHIDYYDVSATGSGTDFSAGVGPSMASACMLAASLVATEVALLVLGRRRPKSIPHTAQFDPYTRRYAQTHTPGGMRNFDPAPLVRRLADRSSLVPQVLDFLYSKPQAKRVAVNGVELYHRLEGDGEPVLLLSPLGNDSSFWARQVGDFASAHRVITYDARGTGVSSPCDDSCSIEQLADDVIAMLEVLGTGPVHLVGLAIGGLVGIRVAATRPDLVRGLVLASCYVEADERIKQAAAQWRELALSSGMEEVYEASLEWVFSRGYVEANREQMDKLRTFFRLTVQDPANFCRHSLAGVAYDAAPDLARVHCPTLVVHGGGDRLIDADQGRRLAAAVDGARLVELSAAPHFLTWEAADRFNREVLGFLADVRESVAG
jgi:pimeloyl-ACP methyl ester carboxylesterase/molybdopterin/thiamine biosynthesis adenylyltransferase